MPRPINCRECGRRRVIFRRGTISNNLCSLTCPYCGSIYVYDSRTDEATLHHTGGTFSGTGQDRPEPPQQEGRFKRA
jgi:ribosomal protein S27E